MYFHLFTSYILLNPFRLTILSRALVIILCFTLFLDIAKTLVAHRDTLQNIFIVLLIASIFSLHDEKCDWLPGCRRVLSEWNSSLREASLKRSRLPLIISEVERTRADFLLVIRKLYNKSWKLCFTFSKDSSGDAFSSKTGSSSILVTDGFPNGIGERKPDGWIET